MNIFSFKIIAGTLTQYLVNNTKMVLINMSLNSVNNWCNRYGNYFIVHKIMFLKIREYIDVSSHQ